MGKPINRAAALLLLKSAADAHLKDEDELIPGDYDLAGVEATVTFSDSARVVRAEGTAGKGYDEGKPPAPAEVSLEAALIFLKSVMPFINRRALPKPKLRQLCLQAILDGEKKIAAKEKVEPPIELVEVLGVVEAERPAVPPKPKKTEAARTGAKEVEIVFRRVPKLERRVRAG